MAVSSSESTSQFAQHDKQSQMPKSAFTAIDIDTPTTIKLSLPPSYLPHLTISIIIMGVFNDIAIRSTTKNKPEAFRPFLSECLSSVADQFATQTTTKTSRQCYPATNPT